MEQVNLAEELLKILKEAGGGTDRGWTYVNIVKVLKERDIGYDYEELGRALTSLIRDGSVILETSSGALSFYALTNVP